MVLLTRDEQIWKSFNQSEMGRQGTNNRNYRKVGDIFRIYTALL